MAQITGLDHLTMLDVAPPEFVAVAAGAGFDAVIIGGRQSLAGCVTGAIGLTIAQQELINLAAYAQLGYGLLVVAVVIFAPTGLVGIPPGRPAGTPAAGDAAGRSRPWRSSARWRLARLTAPTRPAG